MSISRTNKKRIIWGAICLSLLIVIMNGCSGYNKLVDSEEEVDNAWGQVENVYQRRADLIPNLISTVKGYVSHEKSTLTAVVEARAKATSITIDPSNMTKSQLANFDKYQRQVSSALSKLMVVVEKYPDLKANQNFMSLQAELAGTENRIAVERRKFNTATRDYNKRVRKFPRNVWAKLFGFEKRVYFEAEKGSDTAPIVEF